MVPITTSILILIPILLSGTQAGENGSGEKIIIHVPYEIHNHHHTHTNYKLIKKAEKNTDKPIHNEENDQFGNEIKTSNSIIATKIPYNSNFAESQFKPQIFHNLNDQPLTSENIYQDFDDKKEESLHGIHNEHFNRPLIGLPTAITKLVHSIHPTKTDFQFGEDNSYLHAFSTDVPLLSLHPSQVTNPSYQVEEKQETNIEKFHQNILPTKQNSIAKSMVSLARNYIHTNQHPLRTGKSFPTIKTFAVPRTKVYSKSNDKILSIPTTKSFKETTPRVSKTLLKNGEEYEHIGYLVVGKNTHKFVGLNNNE